MTKKRRNFFRFLGYVRPYIKYLILAVIGGVIKFTIPLLYPLVVRYLIDDVFINKELTSAQKLHEVYFYAGGLIAIFLVIYVPGVYLRHLFADKAGHRAVFNLRCDLYYRILRMSASFFSRNKSGEIISRLISDVQLAQNLVGSALTNIWMDAVALFVILFFLFSIDVPTTLVALPAFAVYILIFRHFGKEIRQSTRQVQDELAEMSGRAGEKISGSLVIRAFGQERQERKKFRTESEKVFSTNLRRIKVQALNQAITGTLVSICPLVIICFAGWRVIHLQMTIGELVAVIGFLGPLYLPLQRFSELNVVFANSMAAVDRIYEIMDLAPEPINTPDAIDLEYIRGRVQFEHVHFAYQPGQSVINDLTFTVEPGQKVALVGRSGSGKSTIISLIPRFYDVAAGRVTIDGYDVRTLKMRSLRSHIGMVLQDPVLFSGTIRENILYGKPQAGDDEVIAAARAANALEFIENLPQGFDSEVGERGNFLSGGQKQRLTIARAFLKNPAILILDEATSSVDSESELVIQQALRRLIAGRTTFIIAHRLSSVVDADQIFVLHEGRIVESGTHTALLAQNGLYHALYERQFDVTDSPQET